jgi:branched-subunit amino acid aminotransferase/4-amino-4-deoxychorismate lyase
MSVESALSDGRDDFGLIETLLWTREGGYWLAEGHRARIANSAAELGFAFAVEDYDAALARACAGAEAEALRVRLVLRRDGSFEVAVAPHAQRPLIRPFGPPSPARGEGFIPWRVALASTPIDSNDGLLRHKTTRRKLYEDTLAASGADEVVFLNEREEVCEGARTNIFVARDGALLTPPLSCGLLPGVLRGHLLAQGRAREAVLRLSDLSAGFMLGNSLRGLLRARLL